MSQRGRPRNHFSLSGSWQETPWLSFCPMETILLHFRGGHRATLLIKQTNAINLSLLTYATRHTQIRSQSNEFEVPSIPLTFLPSLFFPLPTVQPGRVQVFPPPSSPFVKHKNLVQNSVGLFPRKASDGLKYTERLPATNPFLPFLILCLYTERHT